MSPATDTHNAMLRHTVATLAYRAGKALRGAPPEFASFRTAAGDLLDWAVGMADGKHEWHPAPPASWDQETARFFAALEAFDQRLASPAPLGSPDGKLFQGPIADALTHVGQINILRRMAGCRVRGENYFAAQIAAGRVGPDQAAPVVEFD